MHTEYQLAVDTADLAQHEPAADALWLRAMSREPHGATITLDLTIVGGRIANLSGQLPVVTPPVAPDPRQRTSPGPASPPMNIVVTENFSYQPTPAKVNAPT